MLNISRWFFVVVLLVVVALGLAGCSSKPIPTDLISRIEKKVTDIDSGNLKDKFNLGFVTLFDSENKEIKFLARESEINKEVQNTFSLNPKGISENALKDNASEIRELSTISVLGLSGIKINDSVYDSCKYISIDNQSRDDLSELICKITGNQEKEQANSDTKALAVLDPQFVKELGEIAGIKNIGFVVLNDYKTGQPKIFLGKDSYINPEDKISFPLLLARDTNDKEGKKMTITSLNTWTVVTYRQNPCKVCSSSGGTADCTYVRDSSC